MSRKLNIDDFVKEQVPIKQGLKLQTIITIFIVYRCKRISSNKTRIKTNCLVYDHYEMDI